jgi:hypothetical protein
MPLALVGDVLRMALGIMSLIFAIGDGGRGKQMNKIGPLS